MRWLCNWRHVAHHYFRLDYSPRGVSFEAECKRCGRNWEGPKR